MSADFHAPVMLFQCRQSFENFGYDLTIGARNQSGDVQVIRGPLTLTPVEPGAYVAPTINLSSEAAVKLMDALWYAGIRPSNGEGNVGQIGAMKAHLDDMRALVFKKEVGDVRS